MPCKCGHRKSQHDGGGPCKKCECQGYAEAGQTGASHEGAASLIKNAGEACAKQFETVQDILATFSEKRVMLAQGKEITSSFSYGDFRGIEVRTLVAEEGFDVEQWVEEEKSNIELKNMVTRLEKHSTLQRVLINKLEEELKVVTNAKKGTE